MWLILFEHMGTKNFHQLTLMIEQLEKLSFFHQNFMHHHSLLDL